jgi:4-hydroxy-tetrahydrodipicolinate reductase
MGSEVVRAVSAQDDMEVVGGFDPAFSSREIEKDPVTSLTIFSDLARALASTRADVLVDFSTPDAVEENIRVALASHVDCVVGTTGLSVETLTALAAQAPSHTTLFHAPNFTLGAVLMMAFSEKAARYFPDVEIIEFHHNGKKDAPSGTARATARAIAESRRLAQRSGSAPGKETEMDGCAGARGANVEGVFVHAVRSDGFVAHQEVIFGSSGETLTLRHDSLDRAAYMPGVLLAIRAVGGLSGLIIGLDRLLDL